MKNIWKFRNVNEKMVHHHCGEPKAHQPSYLIGTFNDTLVVRLQMVPDKTRFFTSFMGKAII